MGWVIKKMHDSVSVSTEIEAIEAKLDLLTHQLEALRGADRRDDLPQRRDGPPQGRDDLPQRRSRATLHDSPLASLFRATDGPRTG